MAVKKYSLSDPTMIFNSLTFLVFIAIFIPVYFSLKGRVRLLWALAGSYLFYGWWDWRFLSLIAISTMVDFYLGAAMQQQEEEGKRKRLLVVSMVLNLGFLGFFKYFGFFTESFVTMLQSFGLNPSIQDHPSGWYFLLYLSIDELYHRHIS